MNEIAQEAELGKGTIYLYLKGNLQVKDRMGLLHALSNRASKLL